MSSYCYVYCKYTKKDNKFIAAEIGAIYVGLLHTSNDINVKTDDFFCVKGFYGMSILIPYIVPVYP